MTRTTDTTGRAATLALELAARDATDDEARARLADVLPPPGDLVEVRRAIRADEAHDPEVRRTALKFVYVASRPARRRARGESELTAAE